MQRRDFLRNAGAAGLGSLLPFSAWAQTPPRRGRSATSVYFDAQGALNGIEERDGRPFVTPRLAQAIRERRIDIISATVGDVGNGPDKFRNTIEMIGFSDRAIAAEPDLLMKVQTAADLGAARESARLGFIFNLQDTTALDGDVDRVDTFAGLGIRVIQLTYNKRNLAGDGCLERGNAGLSDFGRQVIARINRARVVLDLSHAGQRTVAEGIAASTAPPAITHSGCRALADLPRNTGDAEMRALAQKGGVFGLYLMPFLDARGRQPQRDDLIRHLAHAVNICGEEHVGIGTDNPFTGYIVNDQTRADHRRITEERQRLGIAAPGESPEVLLFVEGYNSADRFDRIAFDLSRRGWRQDRIDKVLGANFLRLFGDVWG
jgi:membrane dipeptidase